MKRVRIGIIGAGRIANVMAGAHSKVSEGARAAGADVVPRVAQDFAVKFGISAVFEDYAKLLAKEEVDAVAVCAPTLLHEEMAIAAAKAGKHIFCQKPMALTVESCESITAAAEKADVLLQTGFMAPFN